MTRLLTAFLIVMLLPATASAAAPSCPDDNADELGGTGEVWGIGPDYVIAGVPERNSAAGGIVVRERRCSRPARASARSSSRRATWLDFWTGEEVVATRDTTVVASAPLGRIPVWVRRGALLVTYPAEHVAAGLGDVPERERPLEATLWGEPRCGRALARLADGTEVRWTRGEWSATAGRDVAYAMR